MREHAIIESAVSSSRIEGVTIEQKRIRTLMLGKPLFRDRNEEEVWGYRNALRLIHEEYAKLPINEKTVLKLHRMIRGEIWDAGIDIERTCPGISRDMIRTVLKNLKKEGKVLCTGRGPGAKWRKKGNALKKG